MTNTAPTIGLNGSMLDTKPTGVGIYSYNIFNTLTALYRKEGRSRVVVYSPTNKFLDSGIPVRQTSRFLQSSRFGKFAAAFRFLWNNVALPFYSRKTDFIFNPTSHGSIFLSNQITTVHDLLSLRYGHIAFHQRLYFRYYLPGLLKKSRLVVTVSESSKKDIIELLGCDPEKIRVIYNGYDAARYSVVDKPGTSISSKYQLNAYLLAVGPTYPHKNFEKLLEAYSLLPPAIRNTHSLVIVGGFSSYISKLKKICRNLQITAQVKFLGYVPGEDLPAFYREAVALVYPSLREGFGFPLLEAMASGCPVACSGTSSMPEVCGSAAQYFDPEQSVSIAETIRNLVESQELRSSLIEKGLVQCRKFSWEKTANSIKQLIDQELTSNKSLC